MGVGSIGQLEVTYWVTSLVTVSEGHWVVEHGMEKRVRVGHTHSVLKQTGEIGERGGGEGGEVDGGLLGGVQVIALLVVMGTWHKTVFLDEESCCGVLISIELVAGGNGVLLGQVVSRCVVAGCRGQEVVGHEVVGHTIVGHEREGGEGEGGWLYITALLVVLGSWHETPAMLTWDRRLFPVS